MCKTSRTLCGMQNGRKKELLECCWVPKFWYYVSAWQSKHCADERPVQLLEWHKQCSKSAKQQQQ